MWPSNGFLTLTYSDKNLPENGTLIPEHHTKFIDNLRHQYFEKTGQRLRYYMVGEYGDKTFRPHYHYALFNFFNCTGPGPSWHNRKYFPCKCSVCTFITGIWGYGHVFLGSLSYESAQYIAGYVTKKMTKPDDPRLVVLDEKTGELISRHPEFTRMSRRPGIGSDAAAVIAASVERNGLESIPQTMRHGNKHLPFGRYLNGKIHDKTSIPEIENKLIRLELQQLRSLSQTAKTNPIATQAVKSNLSIAFELVNGQKTLQLEQRHNRKVKTHEI